MTMEQFLNLLFTLSLSGSIIFCVWKAFRFFFQKLFTNRVHYYLLLIVLLRFLLPITVEHSLISTFYPAIESTSFYEMIFGAGNSASPIIVGENVVIGNNVVMGSTRTPIDQYIFYFWLIVAFFLAVQKMTKYQSFIKYIKADWTPVDDPEILDILSTICEEKKITRPVELYTTELISSPLLLGMTKSSIVLPHTNLTNKQLYHILSHELTHYKSKDLLYKWLMQLILCLHWFNPLIYLINRTLNRECEYACDEASTRQMTKEERYQYGMTLIEMTKHSGTYKEQTAAVTLYENANEIQNRLKVMVDSHKLQAQSRILITFVALLLIGCSLFTGAYDVFPRQQAESPTSSLQGTTSSSQKAPGRQFYYKQNDK